MKVFVSGASGLIGSGLCAALGATGHTVCRLVRKREAAVGGDIYWNPAAGELDAAALADADAVVNLAGESIAGGRWTAKKKAAILTSRIQCTRTIATALAQPNGQPKTLVNASAVGIYGNRGDELLDEDSAHGSGDFLSDVCRQWEAATAPATEGGCRVVMTRFGVVLSGEGGALPQMLTPFKFGVGGKLGSGRQYMAWVSLDDTIDVLVDCVTNSAYTGPVNVVSPQAVTNYEFTKTLGRVLHRPTIFPVPAFAARLAFGQMADELLLASQRVRPKRLEQIGYNFKYPKLERALERAIHPWAHGVG
jgi:uncharacterized protein (TIGR01777 family)